MKLVIRWPSYESTQPVSRGEGQHILAGFAKCCPKCGSKMIKSTHRRLACACGCRIKVQEEKHG